MRVFQREVRKIESKEVRLKRGTYNESSLVDKVCSEAQRRSYHHKEKFASGKHQSMFLDTLARYCDYEYDSATKKYRVLEVYKYPKSLYDSKIHKGIYQYLAPLILYQVVYGNGKDSKGKKDRMAVITSLDLAHITNLVNSNYNNMKYNQDAAQKDLEFDQSVLAEYFNKADNRIDDYIRRCIKYLSAMNCVIYNETHMIGIMPRMAEISGGHVMVEPPQVRRATDEEMELYAKLVEQASKKAKITYDNEKWYGKKALRYNTELTRLMRENGIIFVCRAFELWRVDESQCKNILRSFADKTIPQRQKEIGIVFKQIMDTNAENRFAKKPNLVSNYIEQFKRLSDITLLYDAEDILPALPSAKNKDYQEKLQEKYGFEIEYGLGGNDHESE